MDALGALGGNSSIKALNLCCSMENNQLLGSPHCMLESLDHGNNDFDNGKMKSLTAALANNSRLKLTTKTKV
jgi:hypothetical protein